MTSKAPIISIVIPTYIRSADVLEIPLKSIFNQTCPKSWYEVILGDNNGGQIVKNLAKKYGAKIVKVDGDPPQSSSQLNLAVKKAIGRYIMSMDHDIEIKTDFIENFVKYLSINNNNQIDAWIVPYKIVAKGNILTAIRNFEETVYKDSIVATPRIIKRTVFLKTEYLYDVDLTCGPADWDLTIQLKKINAKISNLVDYYYHHEESMSFWQFLNKKTIYAKGGEIYRNKWKKADLSIYNNIVVKQYSPYYRLFEIFIENGKWKYLIKNIHLYIPFLILKISILLIYITKLKLKSILFR